MITMVDYGGSNIRSVQKAFEAIGATVQVTGDPDTVRAATRLVLPGVGAFGAGIAALRARGLADPVIARARAGVPLLGICVGMQFLFDSSEEMGQHDGLGLIAGRVRRFPDNGLKVPHMGWNQLHHEGQHPLLAGLENGAYTYFVHSYYCQPDDQRVTLAATEYGAPFAAIVGQDNVMGLQFHPEKSQQVGLRILRNFVERV